MPRLRSTLVTVSIGLSTLMAVAAPTNAGGGEASKSPQAILSDMQRDLRKVKSYRIVATVREKRAVTKMSGDILTSGSVDITISDRRGTLRMRQLPQALYMKADARYWKAVGGKNGAEVARKVAGRWVKVPASSGASLKPVLVKLSPAHLASCMKVDASGLTNNGIKKVGGRRAIELEFEGGQPGTAPGLLYVAADGPVLPLVRFRPARARPAASPTSAAVRTRTTRRPASHLQQVQRGPQANRAAGCAVVRRSRHRGLTGPFGVPACSTACSRSRRRAARCRSRTPARPCSHVSFQGRRSHPTCPPP